MSKIITIGREFGSGGRELGKRLADELGYIYYDKEIITEIAKRTSLSEQYVKGVIENNPHEIIPITIAHSFSYFDNFEIRQKQAIIIEQEKVIKEMADKGDCIIVGRCADYILRDKNPFRVFVYSSMQSKIDRCKLRLEKGSCVSDKEIKKQIKKINKARAKYYSFFTGQKWGDILNYDICINTTGLAIKHVVKEIANMIKNLD